MLFLQLDICAAEMKRKGFASESTLQHAQRWIEVVLAVCGADSFTNPSSGADSFTNPSSACSSEQVVKRACVPAVGSPLAVAGGSAAAAARHRQGQAAPGDGAQQQHASSGTDAAAALRSLLLQQQPPMIDRAGKHIGAASFGSFEEVYQRILPISIYVSHANCKARSSLTAPTLSPWPLSETSS